MNDSNVFVLGAGASFDLGFPLGTKLVSEVLQTLSGSGPEEFTKLYRLLAEGYKEETVLLMGESLRKSGLSSIDRFLEQHRENSTFQDIGYKSIANIIHYYETERRLYTTDHWYGLLHNRLFEELQGTFRGTRMPRLHLLLSIMIVVLNSSCSMRLNIRSLKYRMWNKSF